MRRIVITLKIYKIRAVCIQIYSPLTSILSSISRHSLTQTPYESKTQITATICVVPPCLLGTCPPPPVITCDLFCQSDLKNTRSVERFYIKRVASLGSTNCENE